MLSFTNPRAPTDVARLTELERGQLQRAGVLFDGASYTAAQRLSADPEFAAHSFRGSLGIWDVVEDETWDVVYTLLSYGFDSGTFFRAGTLEVAAEVIQGHLAHGVDAETYNALGEALDRARAGLPPGRSPRIAWQRR